MAANIDTIIRRAREAGIAIPAFNVPYLPMVKPVIRAVVDQDAFALVAVARLEWIKFESQSPKAVFDEFVKWAEPDHVRLHLDHVPVIDEDNLRVDYLPIIRQAIELGYDSVMIDASRLALEGNIKATREVVELAHKAGVPCEAELGAVMGHEKHPPPYEDLYSTGEGFTDVREAEHFVRETGCDWLSVAIGNIHGAVSKALRDKKKVAARLNLDRLQELAEATGVPLVLHGGSGVQKPYLLEAINLGIAKVNVATEIRQVYEAALRETRSVPRAQKTVYNRTSFLLRDLFGGSRGRRLVMD